MEPYVARIGAGVALHPSGASPFTTRGVRIRPTAKPQTIIPMIENEAPKIRALNRKHEVLIAHVAASMSRDLRRNMLRPCQMGYAAKSSREIALRIPPSANLSRNKL